MKGLYFLVASISALIGFTENAKILGIFPVPSISHQVVYRALFMELASRGHDITIMTADPVNTTLENYKQIDVHNISYGIWNQVNFASHADNDIRPEYLIVGLFYILIQVTDAQLQSKDVQGLLHTEENFDLVFIESYVSTFLPLKDKFKCPLILFSSTSTTTNNMDSVGNPSNPALYPDVMAQHIHPMSFFERMRETYTYLFIRLAFWWYLMPKYNEVAQRHFGKNIRKLEDIESDVDLMFLNFEPVLLGVRPTVPAVVHLGGMQLKKPQPLPKELQQILDENKKGVIYFSLGSNVKAKDMSLPMISIFLKVFEKLPYTVLWKFENETLDGKPKNVYIRKWFPQQDVLAHPNVKLFISQCGIQSLEEAINSTVPLIGFPFFGDQIGNAKRIIRFQIGRMWNLKELNSDTIRDDIVAVIENPIYKKNIKKLSDLIKDKPETSMERAVWWTEYVLRHKGAKHLRSPSAEVTFLQSLLIDIFAFCLFILIVIITFVICVCCALHKILAKNKIKRD